MNGFRRFPEPAPAWVLAVLVGAYWALVWVGLHLLVVPPRLSAFWPAGGLALAGLLLVPGRQWPVLLASWFVVHAGAERFAGFPIVLSLAYPAIALGEVTLGAWLIRRTAPGTMTLGRTRCVLALVGWMALLATPLSATLAAALQSGAPGSPQEFGIRWLVWWTGDALGALVVTPLVLTAPGVVMWWREVSGRLRLEAGLAFAAIVLLSAAILGARPDQASMAISMLALPYPLFVWLALRSGPGGVAVAIAAMSGIAAWQAGHGEGPFMLFAGDPTRQVLILQVYLASVVVPSLFLAAAAREARDSARHVREIYEYSSEAIVLFGVGREGRFVYEALNPRSMAVLGPRGAGAVGRTPQEILPPEAAGEVDRVLRRALDAPGPITLETTIDLGQGPRIWQSDLIPIRDRAGVVRRIAGFGRDITEQRQSERARAALEHQLRHAQKMDAVGRLAGGLAHEFNNILTAMLGHAEILGATIPAKDPRRESVEAVLEGGVRAASLVRQVLTFSRRQEQPRAPVRVQSVALEALRLVRATVPSTIEIRQSIDPSCPLVLADPTQIYQVLINLVSNAVYAMRARPGVLTIDLRAGPVGPEVAGLNAPLPSGTYVCLSVTDTGTGMTPEMLEQIYEPFYTTKPPGEGTGLGLPVVLGIMQSHEGGMAIESEPGRGTTVRLYFPALPSEAEPGRTGDVPPPRGSGERVLFVDDEPSILQLGERVLAGLGYGAVPCRGPEEALAAFRNAPETFAAAITDLTMPGMTGVQLAAELRRIHPGLPIILTTGVAPTGEGAGSYGPDVAEVLLKPYMPATLGHALARVMSGVPR